MFRKIRGYPDYAVDDLGSVWSKKTWRILRPQTTPDGYLSVNLYKGKKRSTKRIHALVLTAFVGPRPEGYEARHVNGDQTDNRYVNLKWA